MSVICDGKNTSIFLVDDPETNEQLVVKTINKHVSIHNFYNELVVENLSHHSLLKITKYDEKERKIYYKYIPNVIDLDKFMKDEKCTNEIITKIAFQLIDVIQYIHSKKIVHRDIKSRNVLVDTITFDIYLIDFEFCCEDYASDVNNGKKNSSFVHPPRCWTPTYVSPYTLNSHEKASYSVDIYALGVTLMILYTRITKSLWGATYTDTIYDVKKNAELKFEGDQIVLECNKKCKICSCVIFDNKEIVSAIPLPIRDAINKMISNVTDPPLDLEEIKSAFSH